MGLPVVTVAAGGMPVVDVTATTPKLGLSITEAANARGVAVTLVTAPRQGLPVTFVSAEGLVVVKFVAEGDSITAASPTYADTANTAAVPAIPSYTNRAVGGTTTVGVPPSLVARATATDAFLVTGGRSILSVLIGANDLNAGTAATYLTNLATYLDARRALGWYVILCTVLPSTLGATYNTNRAAANTEMRLWVTGGSVVPGQHADRICDFAADPTIGDDADAANTTYYVDGLHPTAAGQAIMRKVFQPVLDAAARITDGTGPTITSANSAERVAGTPLALALTASESCYWSVSGSGFSIATFDTLAHTAGVAGTFPATITATDGSGNQTSQSFTLTVTAVSSAIVWTQTASGIQDIAFASSTATFTAMTVGSAASDMVFALVSSRTPRVTGVSIGGNAMTRVAESNASASNMSIWAIQGSYTTPNVVATAGAAFGSIGVTVGKIVDAAAAASATAIKAYAFTNDPQVTAAPLVIPAGGVGIAVLGSETPGAGATWNVGAEEVDISTAGWRHTSGVITTTGSQTPSISGFAFAGAGIAAVAYAHV